ncbi:ABC transporter substrate-binding protein [Psychromonas algarum]|uniref:ABC transporter substrate-binding protein n=1 Tax=Psychromonas algarum TaxID=2555643 RepID=UPI0014197E77|nr:ABC transporter substrate-binding protein [Psychromonas sp. RZ22]
MNLFVNKVYRLILLVCLFVSLLSCTPYQKPLTIGAAPWPNFEFAFLANELGYLNKNQYSLLELTSSTSVIQAFQTGKLDVAFLSLDQVLTLVALGLDLKIISVVDNSYGGDALMAKPEIKSLQDLKWSAIGYENKAAGALLLDEVFNLTGLNNQTVQLHEVKQNEIKGAYLQNNIDALIVREPVKQQLLALGARELINSKSLSLPITNVMVARGDIYQEKEGQIANFVRQFYRAHMFYKKNTEDALTAMSVRLQLYPYFLKQAFLNTRFIDSKQSLMRLSGSPSNIQLQAERLSKLMSEKHMLGQIHTDLSSLITTRILERAIYE